MSARRGVARRPRPGAAAVLVLCATLAGLADRAEARSPIRRPRPVPFAPPPPPPMAPGYHGYGVATLGTLPAPAARGSLRARLGLEAAKRMLGSTDAETRARGLERLGAIGTTAALDVLVAALDASGAARTSPERLAAARALAPHAEVDAARQALVRLLAGVGAPARATRSDAERLVRGTAALGLAASGSPDALAALGQALRQQGAAAEAAADALEAHPPRDLEPILRARGAPTPTLVRMLARLGDQRAFHALRQMVRRGDPAVRAEAAVALTRLGHLETVPLAQHWLAKEKIASLRIAAARILAETRAPEAPAALAKLLDDEATRDAALGVALDAPGSADAGRLARLAEPAAGTDGPTALAALARTGGPAAARTLAARLADPSRAAEAAHALATAEGDWASTVLANALGGAARRHAARAAAVREVLLGAEVQGLKEAVASLLGSREPAERAAGAWATCWIEPERQAELVGSSDGVLVRAAARARPLRGQAALAAAERLGSEKDALVRTALAAALGDPEAARAVPTTVLLELLEERGAASAIAAETLAARDEPDLRPRLRTLLESGDAVLRAHVALGLGRSARASATGILAGVWARDADERVRHAAVVGLSRRSERSRLRTLRLAASLDPSRDVREAARAALAGHLLAARPAGSAVAWVLVAAPGEPGPYAAAFGAGLGGLLPGVADPDGFLGAGGLGPGLVSVQLAPPPEAGEVVTRK